MHYQVKNTVLNVLLHVVISLVLCHRVRIEVEYKILNFNNKIENLEMFVLCVLLAVEDS